MEVKVRLYATLARHNPEGEGNSLFSAKVNTGATVRDLLRQLGVAEGEVKQVFIKYKARSLDYELAEGEQVALFPAVAGG